MRLIRSAWILAILLLVIPPQRGIAADSAATGFKVLHRISPGGEGGWDALTVDPLTHRLFISRSTHVQVVDLVRDTLIGDIQNTLGVHGIALAPEFGRGYTSDGRDSTVTVFDLKTLATVTVIKLAARNPDALMYDPISKRVFTFNGGSNNATAIDAQRDSVIGSVPLNGRPEFATADGEGHMFVNLEDSSAVVCFDTRTLAVEHRWPLAPGEGPSGLAMDREHHRLFAGCGNKQLIVLDANSGARVAALPIGEGVDGVDMDARHHLVFSSQGDGTLTVIRQDTPDHYTVLENVTTQKGARTLAVDESTGRVYVVTAEFGPPPPPTADRPHPRPPMVPGSFVILELGQ